jgi:hypothetical protein
VDADRLIQSLERFGGVLNAAVAGLSNDDTRWRPAEGAWSILEIVCHLADEEVEDFRARLRSTLEDPARPWAPIDPVGAAITRRYGSASLDRTRP